MRISRKDGFPCKHIRQMKCTFHGKSAHAQVPWEGSSALDAVLLIFHAVDMIRGHSEPQFHFHGIVSDGGAMSPGRARYALEYGGVNPEERQVPRHWEETGFATLRVPGVHIGIGTDGLPEVAGHPGKMRISPSVRLVTSL